MKRRLVRIVEEIQTGAVHVQRGEHEERAHQVLRLLLVAHVAVPLGKIARLGRCLGRGIPAELGNPDLLNRLMASFSIGSLDQRASWLLSRISDDS